MSCTYKIPQGTKPTMGQESIHIKYLALGDSYTKGESVPLAESFPYQLATKLEENPLIKVEVKIIAQTGWTTQNLLDAISEANIKESYDLVSLLIGVNNQYQNKPISVYKQELPMLIDKAIQLAGGDTSKVLMMSIPDYAFTPFGQGSVQISEGIDIYNGIAHQFAAQYGIKYVNITPSSREGLAKPELVAKDGLHPSGKMYGLWVEAMLELVRAMIEE